MVTTDTVKAINRLFETGCISRIVVEHYQFKIELAADHECPELYDRIIAIVKEIYFEAGSEVLVEAYRESSEHIDDSCYFPIYDDQELIS